MIEVQARFPEFPVEPWLEMVGNQWQWISLKDIKKFRFRFHGKLVEERRYLCAYIEREIIYTKLLSKPIYSRLQNNEWKR